MIRPPEETTTTTKNPLTKKVKRDCHRRVPDILFQHLNEVEITRKTHKSTALKDVKDHPHRSIIDLTLAINPLIIWPYVKVRT
jgi:phenylalanyl-tRNA synthetase alpha subunit